MKKFVSLLAVFILTGFTIFAEQVSRLYFTAGTKTEKISITITDKEQTMVYLTPSRDIKYSIIDYDVQIDTNSNTKIVTATVVDQLYNTAFEVLLYSNNSYSDIRIGKKRVSFSYVQDFRIQ